VRIEIKIIKFYFLIHSIKLVTFSQYSNTRITWSLTLRQESRLRVFENRILRLIIGPKRVENGEWRRLHNEELHSLYRPPNIFRRLRWAGHVARMEEGRSAFKIFNR